MAAIHNSYFYDNRLTRYYLHHHNQNAAIFGYVLIYSQYWVPLFLQYQQPHPYVGSPINHNVINHQYEEEEEELVLNEEELREWDLLDEELVIYDSTDNDDGLSDETITKHLKTTTDHHQHHVNGDD
ncbi:hypothetical protein CASFOL_026283 [Castilleja foliolosa]|uniref:Deformed n=1 Tax=Castilleja foliolosa TaxID=1961234 RepID=A0ABD3CKW7_9LAMI